jgi:hypothetical protein
MVTVSRGSRIYLALYFNVERAEDLDLLTLLYALPVTRRGPAVKHVLRAGLNEYLQAHYPDRPPLDRQAVHDLVATRARIRRRRREPAADGGRRAPSPAPVPNRGVGPPGMPGQGLEELTGDAGRAPAGNAEVRLDRLLRSFLR